MNEQRATVSIVVLSYNRPALLREALGSLCAQTYAPFEIIVVDNRSSASDEVARVVREFPSVKLIRNDENKGFAAGINLGVAEARGAYVYLTEDDIVLKRDCVRRLVEFAESASEDRLISPVMYNKNARTIRCAGGEVSLGGVYRRTTYTEDARERVVAAQPFDVSYIDGAVVFARTDYLKRLRGFREEFFMYVESVELCVRVSRGGGRMTVVPRARVYHFEPPADATEAPDLDFHRYKNLFSLYLLHAAARRLPEFFCRYALLALVRAALGVGGDARALMKALLWVSRRAPSLLRERHGARSSNGMAFSADGRAGAAAQFVVRD